MRAPLRLQPPWSKQQYARIKQAQREFHVRAFGEELARVNLDLTEAERHRYLDWMAELARRHGVRKPREGFPGEYTLGREGSIGRNC
jgi:hypothetical protein